MDGYLIFSSNNYSYFNLRLYLANILKKFKYFFYRAINFSKKNPYKTCCLVLASTSLCTIFYYGYLFLETYLAIDNLRKTDSEIRYLKLIKYNEHAGLVRELNNCMIEIQHVHAVMEISTPKTISQNELSQLQGSFKINSQKVIKLTHLIEDLDYKRSHPLEFLNVKYDNFLMSLLIGVGTLSIALITFTLIPINN